MGIQMRLYCLIVETCLLCVAGVATLSGQITASEARHAPAALALAAGENSSSKVATGAENASVIVAKGEYTGDVGCRNCHKHDKIWDSFYKDPHFKSTASGKEPPERTGCEGCHGPGKAHVDAAGDITTVVYAFSVMKPAEIIDRCLTCHAKEFNRANIRRSEHTENDVACTDCHSIHSPVTAQNLLAKSEPDACYQFHRDVRSQFNLPFKHRVNEGFMSCTD